VQLNSTKNQAPPRKRRSLMLERNQFNRCQRPKNSQSRMMIGIGTPNNHNKTPRPIVVSSKTFMQ